MGPKFHDEKTSPPKKKTSRERSHLPSKKATFGVDDVQFSLSVGYGLVPSRLLHLFRGYNNPTKKPRWIRWWPFIGGYTKTLFPSSIPCSHLQPRHFMRLQLFHVMLCRVASASIQWDSHGWLVIGFPCFNGVGFRKIDFRVDSKNHVYRSFFLESQLLPYVWMIEKT